MISISSYLHKSRHNIFYFRVVAPQAAGKHAGREIRISLKTKELPVATRYVDGFLFSYPQIQCAIAAREHYLHW